MSRRAFSLVEITVAIFLIALVTALVLPRLGGASRDDDTQARYAVSALADVQTTVFSATSAFAAAPTLTTLYPDRLGAFTVTDAPSTSPLAVSISTGGTAASAVVGLAAFGSSECWMLRLAAATPPRWAVGPAAACSGAAALALTPDPTDPTLGLAPDRPIRLP